MILTNFYEAILARLIQKEVQFEYFDIWNDQLERNADEQDTLHFNYPAIFLEIEPFETETLGRRKQQAELTFNLIIASELLHETANIEDPVERARGLDHLRLLDNVFAALQGFNKAFDDGSSFGSITRTGVAFDHESGGSQIIAHEMPFKCRIVDTAAMVPLEKIESPAFCNNVSS